MFIFIDRLVIDLAQDGNILQNSLDDVFLTHVLVRLDARKTQRGEPFHRFTGVSNNFSTLGKPILDIISVSEQISNTFDSQLGQIMRCLV